MARPVRVEYEGAVCHVTARGNEQKAIYADDTDRRAQIWARVRLGGERLVDVAARYGFRDGSGVYRVVKRLEALGQEDVSMGLLPVKCQELTP